MLKYVLKQLYNHLITMFIDISYLQILCVKKSLPLYYNKSKNRTMKIDKMNEKITIRLKPDQNFELDKLSKELSIDKSKLIRSILTEFLNKYNK